MKAPPPRWIRYFLGAFGALDFCTGVALVAAPVVTLQMMGIAPPGLDALGFVRFVGAFVAGVGAVYLLGAARGHGRALRETLDLTRVIRGAAGLFTGVMVFAGSWPVAWLSVTGTDLTLVIVQTVLLATYFDE